MRSISLFHIAAMTLIFAFMGCSKKSSSPIETTPETTPQVSISPDDGSTDIRLDASIGLSFAKPVDRTVVQRSLHLISRRTMADTMCPVYATMRYGDMMSAMPDTGKMHHPDTVHAARGMFFWNIDSTVCTFRPDSLLSPKTQYMVHLGREMVQMMEMRMGSMGSMNGHGSGMMSSEMMFHFTTLDTASTSGSGHAGHH